MERSGQQGHAHYAARCPVVLLVVVALAGAAVVHGGAASPSRGFAFGVIGDMPYHPEQEAQFPHLMQALNEADLAFVVHVGDLKASVTPCSDEVFAQRKALFHTSKHPFIYLPGDNEWSDCHEAKAADYDPLERLTKLRELFFSGGQSLGQRVLPLTQQSYDPAYAKFRENVRWAVGEVLFVGLHLVGSNNNRGRTPEGDAEYAERNAANLVWLKQAFAVAKRDGHKGLVLLTQANPYFEDRWPPFYVKYLRIGPPIDPQPSGFSDFLTALEAEVLAFDRPVVLVHGDTHYFRVDKPLFGSTSRRMVEHFTRVETFGARNVHWVRGLVDPTAPEVLTFTPEIVKHNRATHGAP
jgi:hypothetical protein